MTATTSHYPVLYLLTGNDQSDSAFLQIGLQAQLDQLIARHAIPPLIAVMIQGGPGSNNWRNTGSLRYESYVLEVQQLIDRMLPTVPARDARAIVGDSMGGYGAMNVALANPYRFGVVESWLGFFNGLEGDPARRSADRLATRPARVHLRRRIRTTSPTPTRTCRSPSALRAAGARRQRRDLPGRTQPAKRSKRTSNTCSSSPGTRCVCPHPSPMARAERRDARALGAASLGALAFGALAGGAVALGAVAVGAVAIGRLGVRRAAIGSLDVGDLRVARLSVGELTVEHGHTPPSTPS